MINGVEQSRQKELQLCSHHQLPFSMFQLNTKVVIQWSHPS